jgi:hypothetical protein
MDLTATPQLPTTPGPSAVAAAPALAPLPALERRAATSKNRVQCKQDLVISWLQEFYSHPGHLEVLLPILKGESPMSLRLIDYFVTNYAKKNNTSYNHGARQFLVYFHYKRELNAYSKRLFDPFCRRERIMFQARGHEGFVTTVGQLNFFRWAIEKQVLTYIAENREAIEKDMNTTLKEHYSRSTKSTRTTTRTTVTATSYGAATIPEEIVGSVGSVGSEASAESSGSGSSAASAASDGSRSRKKRSELTKSAMKRVNFHACEVTVNFS